MAPMKRGRRPVEAAAPASIKPISTGLCRPRPTALCAPFAAEDLGHPRQDVGPLVLIFGIVGHHQLELAQLWTVARRCKVRSARILPAGDEQFLAGLAHPPIVE